MNASSPSPRAAFWLSFLVPGLGLFYAGAPLRAGLVVVLVLLGLGGIVDSASFMDRRPEYAYYGALATVVLVAAWLRAGFAVIIDRLAGSQSADGSASANTPR